MLLVLLLACSLQELDPELASPEPRPAIEFVVEALTRHDLVAISEDHDLETEHEFLRALISDSGFHGICRDVVVEFASARHQETLDRYLAGEPVPFDQLAPVWRDTPVSPFQTWDSPVYAQFLRRVRELNQSRPADERLRVWASEEPIDWSAITTPEQHYPYLERAHYPARVTWEQVLSQGRKALLIRGGGHLFRDPASQPVAQERRNVLQLLVEEHGVDALTIELWSDGEGALPELERSFAEWPTPSIATLDGTWLEPLPASPFFDFKTRRPDGTWGPPFEGVAFGELFDALLYLGPTASLRRAPPDTAAYSADYRAELDRRRAVFGMAGVFGVAEDR